MTKKLIYEDVKKIFESKNCILLDSTYKNSRYKLNYICSCGNHDSVFLSNFKRYGRCKKCSAIAGGEKNKKFTQEFVKNYFKENNCLLLSNYQNARSNLDYICSCGNIDKIMFSKFKIGQRCRICKYKKISEKGKLRIGEKNPRWNPNREEINLNKTIHIKFHSMIQYFLSNNKIRKDCRSHEYVGYTRADLKKHITNHKDWEKIKNKKWSVDHIFPVKAFLDHEITDPKIIHCLNNLQPMLLKNNISKSAKYSKTKFLEWLKNNYEH